MKKIGLMSLVLIIFSFSCTKEDPVSFIEPLYFHDLRVVADSNLKLEDVVTSYSQYQDENGNPLPNAAYVKVLYKGVVLERFDWIRYQAPIATPPYIFWAKTEKAGKSFYVFSGNGGIFDINVELYVVDGGDFKTAVMLENDSIVGIVSHQITEAFVDFQKQTITIRGDPNSGRASYGIDDAIGEFKY